MNPITQDQLEKCKQEIEKDLEKNKVLLFMKGTKEAPQCGFSAQVIQVLNVCNTEYAIRNVLEDDILREAIKQFSDWPTIPQLYINKEFIGGCDIIIELYQSGELETTLKKA